VVCPRLVPRTPLSHIPYAQAPAEVQSNLYVLSFNNGAIHGTLHWIAVYRYPRNAGGFQSGQVAAFALAGGRVIFRASTATVTRTPRL
jgi:hypothetical protein